MTWWLSDLSGMEKAGCGKSEIVLQSNKLADLSGHIKTLKHFKTGLQLEMSVPVKQGICQIVGEKVRLI